MLRRRQIILFTVLLLAGVAPLAANFRVSHSRLEGDAKRQVAALEEQWRKAQLSGDVSTLDRLLASDFIGITATGEITTKSQQLDHVRKRASTLTAIKLSDRKVKLIGISAVVTSRAEVESTLEGTPARAIFRYTRVYRRLSDGVWQVTNFEATRILPPKGDRGKGSDK